MCPMLPLMSEALSYCFIMSSLHLEWLWAQHTAAWWLSPCVIMCHTNFLSLLCCVCCYSNRWMHVCCIVLFPIESVRHIHLVKHMKSTTDSKVFGCNFEPESLFMWLSVFSGLTTLSAVSVFCFHSWWLMQCTLWAKRNGMWSKNE